MPFSLVATTKLNATSTNLILEVFFTLPWSSHIPPTKMQCAQHAYKKDMNEYEKKNNEITESMFTEEYNHNNYYAGINLYSA